MIPSSPLNSALANALGRMMSVYLQGNSKDHGQNNISLYVNKISKPDDEETAAISLRFFIYDYKRSQYLMIQDSSLKEFDAANTKCGLPRALDLIHFHEARNGFIKSDCCTFGVEIFYHTDDAPAASLAPFKEGNSPRTHAWMSDKYGTLSDNVYSPRLYLLGHPWRFNINPKGYGAAKGITQSVLNTKQRLLSYI